MVSARELAVIQEVSDSEMFIGNPGLNDITIWRATGNTIEKLFLKPESDESALVAAPVEWVGEVLADGFRLVADGGYNGHFDNDLSTQKAYAKIGKPPFPAYDDMWSGIPGAIKVIQNTRRNDLTQALGNTLWQVNGIRVRHALFTPIAEQMRAVKMAVVDQSDSDLTATSSESDGAEEQSDKTNPFSLVNWPCSTDEARAEVARMIRRKSHEVHPIPAYDTDGSIILPSMYERKLKGAIVHIKATLVHQFMVSNHSDNFYAEIEEMNMVTSPLVDSQPSSSKRKFENALETIMKQNKKSKKGSGTPPVHNTKSTTATGKAATKQAAAK